DQCIPAPYGDREIERANYADHSQRMPLLIHPMSRALAVHREAVKLARETDGEVCDIDHLLHFAFSFGEDLAHFERHELTQFVFRIAERVSDLSHDLAAFRRRDHAPSSESF